MISPNTINPPKIVAPLTLPDRQQIAPMKLPKTKQTNNHNHGRWKNWPIICQLTPDMIKHLSWL